MKFAQRGERPMRHKKPEQNSAAIRAALIAHGLDPDKPSQLADAFRLGWMAAQPGWEAHRCAECDCVFGAADCNWLASGFDWKENHP